MLKFFTIVPTMILMLLLYGCSGYRFRNPTNPLAQYNINSVSVPMFQNRSTLPDVGGIMTQEIVKELCKFPELKVYPGDFKKSDAILLGIVNSKQYLRETVKSSREYHVTSENLGESTIGKRRDFRIPAESSIALTITLILIKNPSAKELDFLLTHGDKIIYKNPKIIFHNSYNVSAAFQREIYGELRGENQESGRSVNYTKNRGMLYQKEKEMALSLASSFREMGLYVF